METGSCRICSGVKVLGGYDGFFGVMVSDPSSASFTVFRVASSPLTRTAQTSPVSQLGVFRRITISPSKKSGHMLSPLTLRAKNSFPPEHMALGISSQSTMSSMASLGIPAGIEPRTGIWTMEERFAGDFSLLFPKI